MADIIAVVNQKGGVGKTTTAVNLGAYLASLGKFVLLVDIDPQANATSGLGIKYQEIAKGVYETLSGAARFSEIMLQSSHQGYKIAPATVHLAGASVELVNVEQREFRLHNALLEVRNDFDIIIIDCPPELGLLTLNGLIAADRVLIPVQAEYYALEGIGQLLNTIHLVKENIKPQLDVLGAVITMYDGRNKLSEEVMHELYKYFPNRIFRSVIPRNVALAEAPSFGASILQHDANSKGARAYERLAKEVLDSLTRPLL